MSLVATVAKKELRGLAAVRSMVAVGVLSGLFFSLVLSGETTGRAEGALFFVPMLVGLSLGYHGCSQVVLQEKTDLVIETLLCSPATLRDLWLGKTLAVTLFGSVFALGVAAMVVLLSPAAFSGVALLHLLVVVPLSVACLTGARGYVQLLFGMRESHAISLGFLLLAVLLLGGLDFGAVLSLSRVAIMGLAAAGVLAVLACCSCFLSPERIVASM